MTNVTEDVDIKEAIKRLTDASIANINRITTLEEQSDRILQTVNRYQEENANLTRNEIQTMSDKMSERIDTMNKMYDDLNTSMRHILGIVDRVVQHATNLPNIDDDSERKEEEDEEQMQQRVKREMIEIKLKQPATTTAGHGFKINPDTTKSEETQIIQIPPTIPLNGIKHSIIVPPSSAAPAFHGKPTESPTQFLIRVEEYSESVHQWDSLTLVKGISQFLRDSALEWYCQLRLSKRRPDTWKEFTKLFLAQFNSPIRKARQEQEWHECKQKEKETINEFLVRLRALWREQKPHEKEKDLVKHLFCRMRTDLLNMIGVSPDATLDEVITEVQQIEDVLYRRAKGERLAKQMKQAALTNTETPVSKKYNEGYARRATTWTNNEDLSNGNNRRGRDHQVNEVTPGRSQITEEPNTTQQSEPHGNYCYRCGGYGHWARNCSMQGNYQQQRYKPYPKNAYGALGERTSRAPM